MFVLGTFCFISVVVVVGFISMVVVIVSSVFFVELVVVISTINIFNSGCMCILTVLVFCGC